eukprot:m.92898 g.92898  ORF g.92898 m.92898 type:complete len:84 (+) comp16526_c0_seq2:111-362(+)
MLLTLAVALLHAAPQFGSDSIRVEDDVIFFYVKTPSTVSYVYRALMAKNFGGVLTSRYYFADVFPFVICDLRASYFASQLQQV